MKQMLRDIKKDVFINTFPKVIMLACAGALMLFMAREYPVALAAAVIFFLLGLWILFGLLSNRSIKAVKELLSTLDAAGEEKLALDYRNAWKGSRHIKIGKEYTFAYSDTCRIYRNSEIIWIYEWHDNKASYFDLYLIDKQKPEILTTTEKTYKKILEYYEHYFPHIVVGRSDEASYLYRNDRNQFLQLKYYNGQK